jgi:hypothetical protein
MLRLSEAEVREFGIRGYVIVRNIIPPDVLAAASSAIDNLIAEQPPPENHVGQHFYWLSTLDGGPFSELFYDTPVRSLAQSLVEPGEIEIAFDQVQVALNIPLFSHRPGGPHLDGYLEGEAVPATFTDACRRAHERAKDRERWKSLGVARNASYACGILSRARARSIR